MPFKVGFKSLNIGVQCARYADVRQLFGFPDSLQVLFLQRNAFEAYVKDDSIPLDPQKMWNENIHIRKCNLNGLVCALMRRLTLLEHMRAWENNKDGPRRRACIVEIYVEWNVLERRLTRLIASDAVVGDSVIRFCPNESTCLARQLDPTLLSSIPPDVIENIISMVGEPDANKLRAASPTIDAQYVPTKIRKMFVVLDQIAV